MALLWLALFAWLAADAALGSNVPLTDEQKVETFERDAGKKLDNESLNHPPLQPRQYSVLDNFIADAGRKSGDGEISTGEMLARLDERQRILDDYFAHHPSTLRVRQWGDCQAYAIAGVVGALILGAIGWIVAGFAVRRTT